MPRPAYLWHMNRTTDQISEDIKTAMRAKDATALNALRALKTALTNAAIEKGGLGTVLEEPEILTVVRKQIKQRQDSIEQFEKAGFEVIALDAVDQAWVLDGFGALGYVEGPREEAAKQFLCWYTIVRRKR